MGLNSKVFWLGIWFIFGSCPIIFRTTAMATTTVFDRVVVEINRYSYTQRQVEIFDLVRQGIELKDSTQVEPLTSARWSRTLEHFVGDMLINQEALRISSIQPNTKSLEEAESILANRLSSDFAFKQSSNRLDLSQSERRTTIATYFRIRRYIASRQGPSSKEAVNSDEMDELAWFVSLRQRTPIRLYEGAQQYIPLTPLKNLPILAPSPPNEDAKATSP